MSNRRAFTYGVGDGLGLSQTSTNAAMAVPYHYESTEPQVPPTFHHFGYPANVHHFFGQDYRRAIKIFCFLTGSVIF